MTIIKKARELIKEHGKDYALEVFNERLKNVNKDGSFESICKISAIETAIEFIKEYKED